MTAKVTEDKCIGCGACIDICPVNAIKIKEEKAVISEECIECGTCVDECPHQAISLS